MQWMTRVAPLLALALTTLTTPSLHAACAKCMKIEADREKEQKEHPQPLQYYDDTMHEQENKEAGNTGANTAQNKSKKGE